MGRNNTNIYFTYGNDVYKKMKLPVQNYLINKSLYDLQNEHAVYASLSKDKRKISLNYDMIECKDHDELSHDCRGLILSKSNFEQFKLIENKLDINCIIGQTEIVAFGMKRFFNYGQNYAAKIDWSDPKISILEKLDGTLCIVYFDNYKCEWCVATRSVPEADLPLDNGLFTFRTLFEKALKETTNYNFEEFTSKFLSKQYTYCFELTTPYNRVIVNYDKNKVTLLSIRSLITLNELDFDNDIIKNLSKIVPIVQSYNYSSMPSLLNWVNSKNPQEYEGVVVKDSKFNRIKIKSEAYVLYHKCRDVLCASERNCMEYILLGKEDDLITYLPNDVSQNILKMKDGLNKFIKKYDNIMNELKLSKNYSDRKLFVNDVISKNLWTAPIFQMYDKKCSNMNDFIVKNKKNNTWSNSFLDKLIDFSKKY